jgi:hypothetical protein
MIKKKSVYFVTDTSFNEVEIKAHIYIVKLIRRTAVLRGAVVVMIVW